MNKELTLLLSLIKAQSVVAKKFDRLYLHGLGVSDFMVLCILRNSPGKQCRRIDLAYQMGLSASGITRLLLPMEKTGLIARQSNARDARVSIVVLTENGEQIFEEASKTSEQLATATLPHLKTSQFEHTMSILKELNADF